MKEPTDRAKHTPGPYEVRSCEVHPHHIIYQRDTGKQIASVTDHHDGTDKATALLLAAAPGLLALARAWALTDPHGTHAKACREAIAKSGGIGP